MGPSGSGKSTLLYCLSGMDAPTAGDVRYRGSSITGLRERDMAELRAQRFGFVYQQAHLVSNLTLFENVAVPGYLKAGRSAADTRAVAQALVERMGLGAGRASSAQPGLRRPAAALRRGPQRGERPRHRLRRRAHRAPSTARTRSRCSRCLGELNGSGQSICMVTHDVLCALRANRVLYLEDGSIKGELELPAFRAQGDGGAYLKARDAQVNAWLSSLAW